MVIASVLALVLAAAEGPISTAPSARPQVQAAAGTPSRDADVPTSAPTDDYGFVAWCEGALRGHMELHDKVKPELDKVSPGGDDTAQTAAGNEYLALYGKALTAAEKASPTNIHNRGLVANATGYRIWAAARAAEPRTQMWSYLMWELPPRCETTARKLEERSSLFGEALRSDGGATPQTQAAPATADASDPLAPIAIPGQQAPILDVGGLRGPQ